MPSGTPQPTQQPTATAGPTTDTGLPTSILGLPVYTVAGINQLAADGKLDGRLAAVAGYWVQEALPCAFMPHISPVMGFCNGGRFGDTAAEAQSGGSGSAAPVAVPETVGADLLWQMAGPANDPARVALIVHAADARSWQCAPADRATCASNLIIDRVAWMNDLTTDVETANSPVAPRMTFDEVAAAGVQAGETLVLAYPLLAMQLNDVDPRFVGKVGSGVVWYVRLMSSTPDSDGVVDGRDVVIDDATGAVPGDLPLAVDATYKPARLVLNVNGQDIGSTNFDVVVGGRIVAQGVLSSALAPLTLASGEYTIHAWAIGGGASPPTNLACDLALSLAAGDDVAYYADWASGGDCTWKEGSLFP